MSFTCSVKQIVVPKEYQTGTNIRTPSLKMPEHSKTGNCSQIPKDKKHETAPPSRQASEKKQKSHNHSNHASPQETNTSSRTSSSYTKHTRGSNSSHDMKLRALKKDICNKCGKDIHEKFQIIHTKNCQRKRESNNK